MAIRALAAVVLVQLICVVSVSEGKVTGEIWLQKSCSGTPTVKEDVANGVCADKSVPFNGNAIDASVKATCESTDISSKWTLAVYFGKGCSTPVATFTGEGDKCSNGQLLGNEGSFKVDCSGGIPKATPAPVKEESQPAENHQGLANKPGDELSFPIPKGFQLHKEHPLAAATIPIPKECDHPCNLGKVWYEPEDAQVVDDINDHTPPEIVGGVKGYKLPPLPALPGKPAPVFKPANETADVRFDRAREALARAQDQRIASADRLKRYMATSAEKADQKVPATLREIVHTIKKAESMKARAMNIFRDAQREIGKHPADQRLPPGTFVSPVSSL